MLISFIEGFLLGMGAAIPLGPINILIMHTAIKDYKSAVSIGLGALSADTVYLLLILLGIATLFNHPYVFNILGIFGTVFLLYMAYLIYRGRYHLLDKKEETQNVKSLLKSYLQGFSLTFVNPYTVAFWISIAGYTASKSIEPFATVLGMIFAILLWITLMPYAVHASKHKISQKVSFYLSVISSIILLGFALSLMLNMFK